MPTSFLNLFVTMESLWRFSVTRNEKNERIDSQILNVIALGIVCPERKARIISLGALDSRVIARSFR